MKYKGEKDKENSILLISSEKFQYFLDAQYLYKSCFYVSCFYLSNDWYSPSYTNVWCRESLAKRPFQVDTFLRSQYGSDERGSVVAFSLSLQKKIRFYCVSMDVFVLVLTLLTGVHNYYNLNEDSVKVGVLYLVFWTNKLTLSQFIYDSKF